MDRMLPNPPLTKLIIKLFRLLPRYVFHIPDFPFKVGDRWEFGRVYDWCTYNSPTSTYSIVKSIECNEYMSNFCKVSLFENSLVYLIENELLSITFL